MTATTARGNRTASGMVRTFVTCQPIVCKHCRAAATHGAAIVDSRIDHGDGYPLYRAMLFCLEHAGRDYYRWPPLTAATALEFGRSRITVGEP